MKRLTQHEEINFLLTNRIPRRYATLFIGWFSKLKHPIIRSLSIRTWLLFADELNLAEAKKKQFDSMHDCFIRELKEGARSIDHSSDVIISPCDGIIGAHGDVKNGRLYQIKGFPYELKDLLHNNELIERYRNGRYVTLRLKSTMYHRFHAPCDCHVDSVNYISGDTWNVNPIALKRIQRLYCKNERAVIDLQLEDKDHHMTLVPVAAILVASIKLNCLDHCLDLRYRGPNNIHCDATYKKGDEMGYFQHGSTIIVFSSNNFDICENLKDGSLIQMGQPLLKKHTKISEN